MMSSVILGYCLVVCISSTNDKKILEAARVGQMGHRLARLLELNRSGAKLVKPAILVELGCGLVGEEGADQAKPNRADDSRGPGRTL